MSSPKAESRARKKSAREILWRLLTGGILFWGAYISWITFGAGEYVHYILTYHTVPPDWIYTQEMSAHDLLLLETLVLMGSILAGVTLEIAFEPDGNGRSRWFTTAAITLLLGTPLAYALTGLVTLVLLQHNLPAIGSGFAGSMANGLVASFGMGSGLLVGWFGATIFRGMPALRPDVRDITVRRGAEETFYTDDEVTRRRRDAAAGILMLGSSPIRPADEAGHILVCGSPGTGKSVALHQMLATLRRRRQSGICIDWDGLFLSRHFAEGDIIFNPWDRRGVRWSPFAEIREDADCDLLARMLVPPPRGGGKEAEWAEFAGKFVAALLRGLRHRPDASPALLHDAIFAWPADKLAPLLKGTSSEQWMDPKNAEFFGSARGSAIRYLSFLKTLGEVRSHEAFSIRDWVSDTAGSGDWLFLSCRNRHRASVQQIVSGLIALAITETLDLPETHSPEDRLWYFCDEIDQSGYIAEFEKGLTLARKHGGAFVLGMQTVGQLAAIYGEADAKAIRGSCNTQVALRCSDPDTAEAMSRVFGDRDIDRETISQSAGSTSGRHGGYSENTSRSIQVVTERAVSAGEIQFLPDLQGFVKHKTGFEQTVLSWWEMPKKTEGFDPC